MKLSFIIPVYKHKTVLSTLVDGIHNEAMTIGVEYEILLVIDGSDEKLEFTNNNVHLFYLKSNFGKATAVLVGLHKCIGDFVVLMDDDGEHDPSWLRQAVHMLREDLVILGQYPRNEGQLFRGLKNYIDAKVYGIRTRAKNSPFKILPRKCVEAIQKLKVEKPQIASLIYRSGFEMKNIKLQQSKLYDKDNSTRYTFSKKWKQMWAPYFKDNKLKTILASKLFFLAAKILFVSTSMLGALLLFFGVDLGFKFLVLLIPVFLMLGYVLKFVSKKQQHTGIVFNPEEYIKS